MFKEFDVGKRLEASRTFPSAKFFEHDVWERSRRFLTSFSKNLTSENVLDVSKRHFQRIDVENHPKRSLTSFSKNLTFHLTSETLNSIKVTSPALNCCILMSVDFVLIDLMLPTLKSSNLTWVMLNS